VKTVSSVDSSALHDQSSKPAKQGNLIQPCLRVYFSCEVDALSSLKQLAPRKPAPKEARKTRENRESISLRPDSLELRPPVVIETLPPALRGTRENEDNAPVDRLGFFFTASRETRHQEALASQLGEESETSSINSFPVSDDDIDGSQKTTISQDDSSSYMAGGSASSTAELLSYAPVGPALRFVSTPENGVRMFVDVSTPSTPTTEPSMTVNVEVSSQSAAVLAETNVAGTLITPTKSTHAEGVRSNTNALNTLLDKLNEAYDKQQSRRLHEWTNFHSNLKVNLPKTLSRASSDYGMASLSRLCSKGTVSPETLKKFNNLILSGIPVSLRREVWMERTGANTLIEPGRFAALVKQDGLDDHIRNEIAIDVDRTMGNNVFFRNGVGKIKLTDILVAYAHFNPSIGYSQGLNIIAGNLLLMLPSVEDAFWLLVAIIENILPPEYYSTDGSISARALDCDGKVLSSYVSDLISPLQKHFTTLGVDLSMFSPGWFISAFSACLSGEPLFRVWDVLFGMCDGRYLFCFALALLRVNRRGLLACGTAEELMLYLGGKMMSVAVGLDVLVKEAVRLGNVVSSVDLGKRRTKFGTAQ
jgi:hypothetical protein